MGHDLGHCAFSHSGERVLNKIFGKFNHSENSAKIAHKLNLTYEVKDAILNHSGNNVASTLEGRIVNLADRIAYINHDIDDAYRAGILKHDDIPKHLRMILGDTHSDRITTMVTSIIRESTDSPEIKMSAGVQAATDELRAFLFEKVYRNPLAKGEEGKAKDLLERLFEYYVKHPDKMPKLYNIRREIDPTERRVCDFISSMTDRYAIELHAELYIPKVWRGTHS